MPDPEPSAAEVLGEVPRRWHLQTRIGIALGLVILGLSLVAALLMLRASRDELLIQARQNLESLSSQMARDLSYGMDQMSREVVTQSMRGRFVNPDATPAYMRRALDDFQELHQEFAHISIIDAATGKVLAATGGIFEGGDASGRPTFEQGKKSPFVGDVHEAVRLAELLPRPDPQEPLRFLDASAPILDEAGRTIRVYAAHIGFHWTEQVRTEIFGPRREQRLEAVLLDTNDKVVLGVGRHLPVGTDMRALLDAIDPATATPVRWPDGKQYLTARVDLHPHGAFPGFGWKVVARQDYDYVTAPIERLQRVLLAIALTLGLLGASMAWLVAGRIVRPVRQLAEAATRAQSGKEDFESLSATPVREVAAVQKMIQVLSERVRGETAKAVDSARRFVALAHSLPHPVCAIDPDGRVEFMNWEAATSLSGVPRPASMDELFARVCDEDRAAIESVWRDARDKGGAFRARVRMHVQSSTPAGSLRWRELEAHPLLASGDGAPASVRGWVGILWDVDEQVRHAAQKDEMLVRERAAREEAERITRLRDEFIATISHELRSPLNAILGWAEIILRQSAPPVIAKAAGVIHRNAGLQAALINDLIDMSAAMAGKLTVRPQGIDLAKLVNEVVASYQALAGKSGLRLLVDAQLPVLVTADLQRTEQVLGNLIGNALKFTPAEGTVHVRCMAQDGFGVVDVVDSGRGISKEFLPFVFDRMTQQDATSTRDAGGLGLGLAIARALIGLQHGQIEAYSEGTGRGARFTIRLPLLERNDMGAGRREGRAEVDESLPSLNGLNVLIVDDEADAREFAQFALSSMGARVRTASRAREALVELERHPFDLLISDIAMPDMDGLALIRSVRAHESARISQLPAIALSAFAMDANRQASLASGFHEHLSKPVTLAALFDAITRSIDGSATHSVRQ